MTKPAAATRAQIERAIRAAQAAGLRVTGIAPDGTVLLEEASAKAKASAEDAEWGHGSPDDED